MDAPATGWPDLADTRFGTPSYPDMIDKKTYEIRQDDGKTVYKSLEEIGDDLPDHSPRYILLSYPLTLVRSIPRRAEPMCARG